MRWLLQNSGGSLDVAGEIARLEPGIKELLPTARGSVRGA